MFKKNQEPIKRVKKRTVNLPNQLELFDEWKNEKIEEETNTKENGYAGECSFLRKRGDAARHNFHNINYKTKEECIKCTNLLMRKINKKKQYTCKLINEDWKNAHRYSTPKSFEFKCPKIIDLFNQI